MVLRDIQSRLSKIEKFSVVENRSDFLLARRKDGTFPPFALVLFCLIASSSFAPSFNVAYRLLGESKVEGATTMRTHATTLRT